MRFAERPIHLLLEPTAPMKQEAIVGGVYQSEVSGRDYPKVQILTIRELVEEHRKPELPLLVLPTYQQAEWQQLSPRQDEMFG